MKVRYTHRNRIDCPAVLLLYQPDGPILAQEHADGLRVGKNIVLSRAGVEEFMGYLQRYLETGRLCDV